MHKFLTSFNLGRKSLSQKYVVNSKSSLTALFSSLFLAHISCTSACHLDLRCLYYHFITIVPYYYYVLSDIYVLLCIIRN